MPTNPLETQRGGHHYMYTLTLHNAHPNFYPFNPRYRLSHHSKVSERYQPPHRRCRSFTTTESTPPESKPLPPIRTSTTPTPSDPQNTVEKTRKMPSSARISGKAVAAAASPVLQP